MPKSAKSRAGGGGSGRRGCPFFGWNRLQEAKDEIVARISLATIQAAEHSLVLLHHHHHRSFWELLGVTLMQDGCTENLGRGRKLSPGQAQAQQSHSLAFHLLNNTLCGIPRNLGMAKNSSSSKTGIHLLHVFLAVMGHRELRGDSYQGAAEPGSSCCATKASTMLKLSWLEWVGNGKKNYCSGNTQRAQIQGTQKKNPTPKYRKAPKGVPGFICGHLCILRGRHSSAHQRRGSPAMGGQTFLQAKPKCRRVLPSASVRQSRGMLQEGSESRQTSAGWKVQPQRLGPGCSRSRRRFSEPRLTSTGRRDHRSPGCSSGKHSQTLPAETGPCPTELSQCSKAGDACGVREFLPRVPGRAAPWGAASSGHRRSWACLCSPSSWCIQDFFLGISPTVSYCSGN